MIALLLAAAIWPPWQTVAQSTSIQALDFRSRAFVAGTFEATTAFTPYLLEQDRTLLAFVDFMHVVLVAALSTSADTCYRLEIVNLRRLGPTLTVSVVLHDIHSPRIGCLFAVSRPYHVISVPRSVIGRPLPRRVFLKQLLSTPSPCTTASALPLQPQSTCAVVGARRG